MPITTAFGLYCYDKFEETSNEKVINLSKLTESYFRDVVISRIIIQRSEVCYFCMSFLINNFCEFINWSNKVNIFNEIGSV